MLILPITSNQPVYKATISAPAQKNAWVVQFTIHYHWQSVIKKALPCQTPTSQFQLRKSWVSWIGFLFEPKIFANY